MTSISIVTPLRLCFPNCALAAGSPLLAGTCTTSADSKPIVILTPAITGCSISKPGRTAQHPGPLHLRCRVRARFCSGRVQESGRETGGLPRAQKIGYRPTTPFVEGNWYHIAAFWKGTEPGDMAPSWLACVDDDDEADDESI